MARPSAGRNVCSVCRSTYTSPSHFTTRSHRQALARESTRRTGDVIGRNTGTKRARRDEAWRLAKSAYVRQLRGERVPVVAHRRTPPNDGPRKTVRVRRHVRARQATMFTELHRLSDGVYRVAFAALPDQLGYLTVKGPARWMRRAARSLQAAV